jgi:putative oxidoreductase
MLTRTAPFPAGGHRTASPTWTSEHVADAVRFAVPLGRALFSAIFLAAVMGHFTPQFAEYARRQGVPAPEILVPLAGVIAFAGGLSILLGYHARIGALLIAVFLVPVTFYMHNFWAVTDTMQRQMQEANFMKNMAMLGAALWMTYCGAGPFSFDNRRAEKRLRR